MCGNGLRCVVWYLHGQNGKQGGHREITVETGAGTLRGQMVNRDTVRILMRAPKELRLGLALTYRGRRYQLHAVNTGVPHVVLMSRKIQRMDLKTLGPWIRRHRLFQPAGTNVNWVQVHSAHRISVRTYERGVEEETLACGTGAVASVVIAAALGLLRPPVKVQTTGGETLTVGYQTDSSRPWDGLYLEGPVKTLFKGVSL